MSGLPRSAGMEELLQRLARAEIDFHSRRLEAPPAEQTTRQAKATHDLWNRRGRETNPGVMEGGLTVEGRALTRVAWLYFRQAPRISPRESRERAERWLFFRQASEVLRQRRAAAEASTRRASGLGSGGGPNLELLRLEYQSLVSAANMTRKLDEEARRDFPRSHPRFPEIRKHDAQARRGGCRRRALRDGPR